MRRVETDRIDVHQAFVRPDINGQLWSLPLESKLLSNFFQIPSAVSRGRLNRVATTARGGCENIARS